MTDSLDLSSILLIKLEWDSILEKWFSQYYLINEFNANKRISIDSTHSWAKIYINNLFTESPKELFQQKREIQSMNTSQLSNKIDKEQKKGNNSDQNK